VDYALIQDSAIYHVAWKLEGAAGAALSFAELIQGYKHSMPSDLYRVRRHNKLADDKAAEAWIVRRAVAFLAPWLVIEDDTVRFKDGVGYDDLRWRDKPIERKGPDPYALFRDPFDKMTGVFSENIRIDLGNLDELRESMKAHGWIDRPQFRAIGDKRGKVVITGHRRIAVAKELGIDWEKHIDWLDFGEGDAADAERFKLAISSNLGAKPLSPNDRKRLAQHLYSEQEWSQQRIADALKVSQQVVSKDLRELPRRSKSGRGRPRVKKGPSKEFQQALTAIAELEKELDREPTIREIRDRTGLSRTPVDAARNYHKANAPQPQPAPQPAPPPAPEPEPEPTDRVCPHCGQPWPHPKENPS